VSSRPQPTLDVVRLWPATVDVEAGASAFGISRSAAYDAIRTGTFPARTLRVGGRIRVVTASIIEALDGRNGASSATADRGVVTFDRRRGVAS
jgi:predicted DNA-binding transcriptional regulator AlpA